MFLQANSEKFNNHSILPDLQSLSDHAFLMVDIIINKEFIQTKWRTIIKNSEEEKLFITELKNKFGKINISDILDCESLKRVVQKFTTISDNLWNKYLKCVKITKHSKAWWNEECSRDLTTNRVLKSSLD